ncbi:hypothetical protein [Mycolicibacterium sp. CBMA 226]|uniref:hypothetical protein n=1 Tax=Mycolicibacterium sp. CBMA 226 TaxID=2606611 RepID=UPI0012DCDC17|nr:hypothetical protein [Mycolicibacterium sp. CBMA 226]MUL78797.1 hypothetical protein [Mycolicibacterium sp. CBMA 226]
MIYNRLVTAARLPGQVYRLSLAIKQRSADKAAGKPVAPINVMGIVGVVLAVGGVIVSRTTSAIFGLVMIVIGAVMILIAAKAAKANQPHADHDGLPPQGSDSK